MRRLFALMLAATVLSCAGATPGYSEPESGASSGAWSLEVTDAWGAPLSTFLHRGRTYVLGQAGERYRLRVRNSSGRRVEAVVSVDGRDAIDGKLAGFEKRGYVIEPYGEVLIDGFRLSMAKVATFRFSSVADSYAARMGNARNVGVIGVAIFPERPLPPPPVYREPRPWLDDEDYGQAERSGPQRSESRKRSASADAAPPAAAPSAGAGRAAPREQADERSRDAERPGLGTEFGERRHSRVTSVSFERARLRPDRVLTLRYNDEPGLIALGIDLDPHHPDDDDTWRRETARPFRNHSKSFASPPAGWAP
jgi:hypothetical protein